MKKRIPQLSFTAKAKNKVAFEDLILCDSVQMAKHVARMLYTSHEIVTRESFHAIFLNRSNRVVATLKISEGGVYSTVVDTSMLVKAGLDCLAQQVVLVHNHPSGNVTPSPNDIKNTSSLEKAFKLFEIHVIDHIIITAVDEYSFKQYGRI